VLNSGMLPVIQGVDSAELNLLQLFKRRGLTSYGKVLVAVDTQDLVQSGVANVEEYAIWYKSIIATILSIEKERIEFFELRYSSAENIVTFVKLTDEKDKFVVYNKKGSQLFDQMINALRFVDSVNFIEIVEKSHSSFMDYIITEFVEVLHDAVEDYRCDTQIRTAA